MNFIIINCWWGFYIIIQTFINDAHFLFNPFIKLMFHLFYCLLQGRCNREKPPCKYFHPPQHLKDQLLINGRNHLALKNALMQQMGITPGQAVLPGQCPVVSIITTMLSCFIFFLFLYTHLFSPKIIIINYYLYIYILLTHLNYFNFILVLWIYNCILYVHVVMCF